MKLEDIKCVGVMGAGVMGGGISQTLILSGYKTITRDLKDEILERARNTIISGRFGLKGGVERGKQTQEEMDQALARLTLTTKVEDLRDCDLIIEAIGGASGELENKPLKLQVFAEVDKLIKKDAIFVSNTSTFSLTDLSQAVERRDRFMGMHWFSPANIMRLVELIYTADTSEETIQTLEGLCQRLGKTCVRVKDVPGQDTGFIGNRVMGAARREAMKIVQEGIATAADVNTAMMLGFNWPVGPLPAGGAPGARSGWQ
jgi:3-hydroxybutyryl-CoA dehydrogenase